MNKDVQLVLTKEEAIVLFEFLSRFSDTGKLSFEDQSEKRILWDLTCLLEKELVEPFQDDYAEKLRLARERVRDKE